MYERGSLFGGDLGSRGPVREYDPIALTGRELTAGIFPLIRSGLIRVQYVVLNKGHNLTQQELASLVESFDGNTAVAYDHMAQEIQAATGTISIYPANPNQALGLGLEMLLASNSAEISSQQSVRKQPFQENLFA
jgi:hypothetical protein